MGHPERDNVYRGLAARTQREHRIPSLVAAAHANGEELAVEAIGVADVGEGLDGGPDVQYRIGSITKTFTAALVVSLSVEGTLGLDDRVEEHIEGTPFGRVTIGQLLSHSGGLQREPLTPMWQTFVGPDEAELAASLPESELVAVPGSKWHYSNLGYAVLGQIVRQATGEDCATLVQRRFLDPLGLTRTSWCSMVPAAVGYRVDPYQDLLHVEPDMDQRAAGMGGQMWSTTADLLGWAAALMGQRPEVLAGDVVEAMHTLRVMVDLENWTQGWGLGLILTRAHGRIYAGHTGAVPGFGAALITDRKAGLVVAVLGNAMNPGALGTLALDWARHAGHAIAAMPEPEPWGPGQPCPPELLGVLGSWWFEAGEIVFSWRAGSLQADLVATPDGSTIFVEEGSDRFRAVEGREAGELLVIERDEEGSPRSLIWATYPYTRTPR